MTIRQAPASFWQRPLWSEVFKPDSGITVYGCLSGTRSAAGHMLSRMFVRDTMEADTGCVGTCNGIKGGSSKWVLEPVCNSLQTRLPRGHLGWLVMSSSEKKSNAGTFPRVFPFGLFSVVVLPTNYYCVRAWKLKGDFFLIDKRRFLLIRALFCFHLLCLCIYWLLHS